eukprot:UN20794
MTSRSVGKRQKVMMMKVEKAFPECIFWTSQIFYFEVDISSQTLRASIFLFDNFQTSYNF